MYMHVAWHKPHSESIVCCWFLTAYAMRWWWCHDYFIEQDGTHQHSTTLTHLLFNDAFHSSYPMYRIQRSNIVHACCVHQSNDAIVRQNSVASVIIFCWLMVTNRHQHFGINAMSSQKYCQSVVLTTILPPFLLLILLFWLRGIHPFTRYGMVKH